MIILMIYLIDDTQDGYTALHYAVRYGYYDCAQLLIQAGAVVNIQSNVNTLYDHIVYHHGHTHHTYILLMIHRMDGLLCTWHSLTITLTVPSCLYRLEHMLISRIM